MCVCVCVCVYVCLHMLTIQLCLRVCHGGILSNLLSGAFITCGSMIYSAVEVHSLVTLSFVYSSDAHLLSATVLGTV